MIILGKITIAMFVLAVGVIIYGLSTATAHDTGYIAHDIAHQFESNYDEVREVYCGWRHGFEGISCVKLGD